MGQPNYTYKDFRVPPKHFRRVKEVHMHPNYRRKLGEKRKQMPRFDFALIEVKNAIYKGHKDYNNFKFEPTMRPICLPSSRMQKFKFVGKIAKVSGYGRIEAKKIYGRHQNAKQLKEAHLRIIENKDKTCEKVMLSYIIIKALDCLVGRM